MVITIYKIAYHVDWEGTGVARPRGGGVYGGSALDVVDLSNYYTKENLYTEGQSVVHFANITDAYHNNLVDIQGGIESSSGDSSGADAEYYHLDLSTYLDVTGISFQMSVEKDSANVVTLVNDLEDPGQGKYYGTSDDSAATKGWHDLPEGGNVNVIGTPSSDDITLFHDATTIKSRAGFNVVWYALGQGSFNVPLSILRLGEATGVGQAILEAAPGYTAGNPDGCVLILYGGQGSDDYAGAGGDVTIHGGSAGSPSNEDGGDVWIIGGNGDGSGGNGSVFILPGSYGAVDGNIYLGAGVAGALPEADSDEIYGVTYNPTTGKLSYAYLGDIGSGGVGVLPFQTAVFANPLNIDCTTYKDWICTVTGDCTVNLNNVNDGDAGMLELIIDGDSSGASVVITFGDMWTKKMGPTDLDMTDGADNIISWRAIGDGSTQEIVYTIGVIEV